MREILTNVAKLYSDNVNTFGASVRSVGWKDEASQRLRFQKLLQVIEKKECAALTVNDLGCGYAAFYQYLNEAGSSLTISKYYGYDISEEMLTMAKRLVKDSNAVFINSEQIMYEADYSFASGLFNVKLDAEDSLWARYIKETLFNMNEKSRKGFAFNALTTHVDYRVNHLYYSDPLYYFGFCKENFSRNASLLQNYGLYEWTIIVNKEKE